MDEWWKALITLAVGIVLGYLLRLLVERRVSDGTGGRVDDVGKLIDDVVDRSAGAEKRAEESVELADDVAGTGERAADSVKRVSEGSDRIEEAVGDAKKSVGRIRDLIDGERKKDAEPSDVE